MNNTVAASRVSLREWATNGLHFAATTGNPDSVLLDERLEISDFYSHSIGPQVVADVVKTLAAGCRAGPLAKASAAAAAPAGSADDDAGGAEPMVVEEWSHSSTAVAAAPAAADAAVIAAGGRSALAVAMKLTQEIEAHAQRYGKNVLVVSGELDEECEREIEEEAEEEEEREEEIPKESPAAEARFYPFWRHIRTDEDGTG